MPPISTKVTTLGPEKSSPARSTLPKPTFQVPLARDFETPELQAQIEAAQDFANRSTPPNTVRAYESDWKLFSAWCDRMSIDASRPDPQYVAAYLSGMATGLNETKRIYAVATIERHLSSICWRYRLGGLPLDRQDGRISTVIRGIRNAIMKSPARKEAILSDDLKKMVGLLPLTNIKAIRNRAILLIGFAGGLRRSEVVGLDLGPNQSPPGDLGHKGWVQVFEEGLLLTIRSKGEQVREIEIGTGSSPVYCPVKAYLDWVSLAKLSAGPVFRRVGGKGRVTSDRLRDAAVADLVKQLASKAGLGEHLAVGARQSAFAGHSLRAGFASSAEIDEVFVQKHLGHASADMTRRYMRRRDRFRTNLTRAAGL